MSSNYTIMSDQLGLGFEGCFSAFVILVSAYPNPTATAGVPSTPKKLFIYSLSKHPHKPLCIPSDSAVMIVFQT